MAVDQKYGDVSIPGIPDDEPVFIIRAQDALSIPAIARYQTLAIEAECGDDFEHGVIDVIGLFADWQTENAESVKKPD